MTDTTEHINNPVPAAELERRWAAVRAAMAERRVDVLLMQANNDFMGGYVKYFTDIPATNGYAQTVIFPSDDRMTVIGQGPFGLDRQVAEGDPLRRGVTRLMGTPSYASVPYSADYDGALAENAMARFAGATVGMLGTAAISYALIDRLKRGKLSGATFIDASDMVDRIKAVKSETELSFVRRTASMQDAAMEAVLAGISPGMREIEVAAIAERVGYQHGSEQGLFLCQSGPVGTPAMMSNRHQQNRVIREGDQFCLLIENNGPGGYYAELGRTCVLGRASQEMKDEHALVLQAQQFALSLLKPGAVCADIWEAYNEFMRSHRRPEERRVFLHGQGYDMVERPLVRCDESMEIGANMYFSLHPAYITERTFSWTCDNYLLNAQGRIEKLHQLPQKIFELG